MLDERRGVMPAEGLNARAKCEAHPGPPGQVGEVNSPIELGLDEELFAAAVPATGPETVRVPGA